MLRSPLFSLALLAIAQAQSLSPSGNYTPSVVQCPSNITFVRPASEGLSPTEAAWLQKRRPNVIAALESYLDMVGIPGFNTSEYIQALIANDSTTPVIGLALSGGGNRASLIGFGMYQALDNRFPDAVAAKTGGILQAMTYIAGLSGGATTTAAVAMNDFATVSSLLADGNLNQSGTPPDSAFGELADKAEAGFNISIADVLGVIEGFNAFQSGNGSFDPMGLTWSGVQNNPTFLNATYPFPILMQNEVIPPGLPGTNAFDSPNGTILFPQHQTNETIYEFTPIEYGSWIGRASAFAITNFAGTPVQAGVPSNQSGCVEGFDTTIFTLGSADSAANLWIIENSSNGTVGQFNKRAMDATSSSVAFIPYPSNEIATEEERVASITAEFVASLPGLWAQISNASLISSLYGIWPNPFFGYNASDKNLQKQANLMLVDGSEVGQVNPIVPLIQPERNADFIIVSDNSGSELSSGWMNGTTFIATATWAKANNVPYPKVPDVNTMLNLHHTTFPTFFGCNERNVPLVLYVADFPYTSFNNFSFLDTFPSSQEQIIMSNALSTMSQDSDRLNANWTSCLACGTVLRSLQKLNMNVPEFCNACFKKHCWQGNTVDSQPSFLAPTSLLTNPNITFDIWNKTIFFNTSAAGNASDA